jgi:hypothetical protein
MNDLDPSVDPTKRSETLKLEYGTVNKAFLRERGWTRTAIKRILGEPDRRIQMVQFRKDRPECLYSMSRVIEAENAGLIRFRKAGNRFLPGHVPDAVADAMMSAPSARQRKKILREWAEREGMIEPKDPPCQRRLQWENVVDLFVQEKNL